MEFLGSLELILTTSEPLAIWRHFVGLCIKFYGDRMKMLLKIWIFLLIAGLHACGDDIAICEPELIVDCIPLYEPVFDKIYTNTLVKKCAIGGTSCHGAGGSRGGLSLDGGADSAYDNLLGSDSGRPVISQDDPKCGAFLARLQSVDNSYVMPPGAPLSEEERCAIRQWLAEGAPR